MGCDAQLAFGKLSVGEICGEDVGGIVPGGNYAGEMSEGSTSWGNCPGEFPGTECPGVDRGGDFPFDVRGLVNTQTRRHRRTNNLF